MYTVPDSKKHHWVKSYTIMLTINNATQWNSEKTALASMVLSCNY